MDTNFVTATPLHLKSISIGPETGVYLNSRENICIGHRAGHKTYTNNNILIGTDINGSGDTITIGNRKQRTVNIGAYDLQAMFDYIKALEKRLNDLEEDLVRPNGLLYHMAKDRFNQNIS